MAVNTSSGTLTIRIKPTDKERFDRRAKKEGRSLTNLMIKVMSDYCEMKDLEDRIGRN